MRRSLSHVALLPLFLASLTGCVSSPQKERDISALPMPEPSVVTKDRTIRSPIPERLLTCAGLAPVPPKGASDTVLAEFIARTYSGHRDCASKLEDIRKLQESESASGT